MILRYEQFLASWMCGTVYYTTIDASPEVFQKSRVDLVGYEGIRGVDVALRDDDSSMGELLGVISRLGKDICSVLLLSELYCPELKWCRHD